MRFVLEEKEVRVAILNYLRDRIGSSNKDIEAYITIRVEMALHNGTPSGIKSYCFDVGIIE